VCFSFSEKLPPTEARVARTRRPFVCYDRPADICAAAGSRGSSQHS
jgi:hypothetical protein